MHLSYFMRVQTNSQQNFEDLRVILVLGLPQLCICTNCTLGDPHHLGNCIKTLPVQGASFHFACFILPREEGKYHSMWSLLESKYLFPDYFNSIFMESSINVLRFLIMLDYFSVNLFFLFSVGHQCIQV